MKKSIDVTLTDFIYAVVVGSAFQHVETPIVSVTNGLILFAFVLIVDDWVRMVYVED